MTATIIVLIIALIFGYLYVRSVISRIEIAHELSRHLEYEKRLNAKLGMPTDQRMDDDPLAEGLGR